MTSNSPLPGLRPLETTIRNASQPWLRMAFFFLMCAALALVSNAQTLIPPNDNTSGPCLGVYSGSIGGTSPTYIGVMRSNSFDYWLNRSQTWILSFGGDYSTWETINTTNSAGISAAARWLSSRPNAQYCFSVPMLPGYTDSNTGLGVRAPDLVSGATVSFLRGANGNYDQKFVDLAQKVVNAGIADRTLVRLGWEFNGTWYPWSAYVDTVNFPIFFARIATVMKSVNANNGKKDRPGRGWG
jgi:hypothetical protein